MKTKIKCPNDNKKVLDQHIYKNGDALIVHAQEKRAGLQTVTDHCYIKFVTAKAEGAQ